MVQNYIALKFGRANSTRRLIVKAAQGTVVDRMQGLVFILRPRMRRELWIIAEIEVKTLK